jgi:biotin transport system substrate-specific component
LTTMADVLVSRSSGRGALAGVVVEVGLVLAATLVVAASARLQYVLPFTPVPINGQTLAVLLVGATLGSRRGSIALAVYLAEGAAGLPVFSGGALGAAWLLGPTGGYLWSYPLVAWVVGALAERGWDRTPLRAGAAMLAGNAVIYLIALPWLALFVGSERVLVAGLLPFLPGDLIKVAIAAAILPTAWAVVGRIRRWAD